MNAVSELVESLPQGLAGPAASWCEQFDDSYGLGSVPGAHLLPVIKAVAVSEFAAAVSLRLWSEILDWDFLDRPEAELFERIALELSESDVETAKSRLRHFRNCFMFRLLVLELAGTRSTAQTLVSLSLLADRLLEIAMQIAHEQVEQRFGALRDADGRPIPLIALGMGKLGGLELNFSSDIDIVFLYPRQGESDGRRAVHAQEYCMRWSQQVVALLDERSVDGFVFRVDTRLRPFGESGPPVSSFAALEGYLLRHGRAWERYAYVKARIVGSDPGDETREELFNDYIRPFVFRRYIDYGLLESLRDMHGMIDAERRGLGNNIKLGRGGIREIEFIVQSLQLLRGGSRPALRTRQLRKALRALASDRELGTTTAEHLENAYLFMRKLENFIQARRDQQTHDLPASNEDRLAIAFAMGFEGWDELEAVLASHRKLVAQQFRDIAYVDDSPAQPDELRRLWDTAADAGSWSAALGDLEDAEPIAELLVRFRRTFSSQKASAEAEIRLARLLPTLLARLPGVPRPRTTIERVLNILEQVLRRSAYIALLNENPDCAARLVDLCGRSAYIADQIARFPVLLDELLDPDNSFEDLSKSRLAEALSSRLESIAPEDAERRVEELARFQRVSVFRIALADVAGGLPVMKASDSLTWLAEVVLQAALELAWSDLEDTYGRPGFRDDGERRQAGFAIVAYGKLGGLELSYGSDLDLVFLHASRGEEQVTDGERPIENSVFFARLVRRLVHVLTTRTSSGVLYEIDTRLRPSGRSGLLVTSLAAFERYQREEAWTWEHQALLRARAVAGDPDIASRFEDVRKHALVEFVRRDQLRKDVVDMREKMRSHLDRSASEVFDLKQGEGGIGDIEFLVQYLVLREAPSHPATIHYSDNIRQLDALAACGALDARLAAELQAIYRRYRQQLHHRILDEGGELMPADAFEQDRAFVRDAWQAVFAD